MPKDFRNPFAGPNACKPRFAAVLAVFFAFAALALQVFAAAGFTSPVSASEFISADEIRPGMRGYGLAQFHGSKIDRFDVEIVSVYGKRHPDKGFFRKIVALVGGGPLEISRGISTGFSGAPVYIGGKLAGAIDGTAAFSAKNYVTITTIEEMMTLFDSPSLREFSAAGESADGKDSAGNGINSAAESVFTAGITPFFAADELQFNIMHVDGLDMAARYAPSHGTLAFVKCTGGIVAADNIAGIAFPAQSAPVFGPGGGGAPSLQTAPPFSYEYFPTGEPFGYSEFTPGAMISIPLVRGDLDIYMYGTLTYVAPDGRFIAFGHSIDGGRGKVSLPVARAHVYTTHTSLEENWSLIASGPIVGTLTEDRNAGGAGHLRPYEDYCPVSVKMRVQDTGRFDEASVEVVRSARHFRDWFSNAAMWALERTADYWGEGTAHFVIRMKLPGRMEPLVMEDVAYSPSDWRAAARAFLDAAAVRLTASEIGEFPPENVEIECDLVKAERSARIWNPRFGIGDGKDFKPFKGQKGAENGVAAEIAPGGQFSVTYNVVLPSGEVRDAFVSIGVPADFPPGKARIQIRGGGNRAPVERGLSPQLAEIHSKEIGNLVAFYAPPPARKHDDLYAEIARLETGGKVIIEIVTADEKSRGEDGLIPRGYAEVTLSQPLDGAPLFVWTDYRGVFGFDVEIMKKSSSTKP